MRPFRTGRAALLLLFVPVAAHAARPMVTDDARIVDAKACQVESWLKFNPDSTEAWALPACNPTGNLELTFGGARTRDGAETGFTDEVVQAKTLFRALKDDWGLGLAVGTVRHPHREQASGWPGDPYFYFPLSINVLGGEKWVVHFNAGVTRHRDEGRNIATWGFGNEVQVDPRLFVIAETFASDRGRPFYQGGVRYWIVKDHVQMDATYGNRFVTDGRERSVSVGLRLIGAPFLP